MYKVIFLRPARNELEDIGAYYDELFGRESAKKVIAAIRKAIMRLKLFPDSGSLPPDAVLAGQGYRMVISGNFVAVYKKIGGAKNRPQLRFTSSPSPKAVLFTSYNTSEKCGLSRLNIRSPINITTTVTPQK